MMLWYVEKLIDDDDRIVYSYGKNTKEQTGKVEYTKANEEFHCLVLAKDDTPKGVSRLFQHLYRLIYHENAPDKRTIATG